VFANTLKLLLQADETMTNEQLVSPACQSFSGEHKDEIFATNT